MKMFLNLDYFTKNNINMSWIFGVNKEQAVPQNFEQIIASGIFVLFPSSLF